MVTNVVAAFEEYETPESVGCTIVPSGLAIVSMDEPAESKIIDVMVESTRTDTELLSRFAKAVPDEGMG